MVFLFLLCSGLWQVTLESCPYGSRTFDNSIIARKKSLRLENSRTPNFLSVPKHSGRIDFLLGYWLSSPFIFIFIRAVRAGLLWIELWPAPQPLRLYTIKLTLFRSLGIHPGRPFKRKVYARWRAHYRRRSSLAAAAGAYPRTRNHFKRQLMPARHYHKIEQHFSQRAYESKKRATKWRRVALLKKVKRASGVYQI